MRSNPSVAATLGPDVRTTEADWERLLGEFLGAPMRVVYGSSRTTPVQARSYRPRGAAGEGYEVRLHRMFANAPEEVRSALASWLRNGRRSRRASETLDRWIHEELERIPAPERRVRLELSGRTYDLGEMRDLVFATEFAHDFGETAGREHPRITWGRRTRAEARARPLGSAPGLGPLDWPRSVGLPAAQVPPRQALASTAAGPRDAARRLPSQVIARQGAAGASVPSVQGQLASFETAVGPDGSTAVPREDAALTDV